MYAFKKPERKGCGSAKGYHTLVPSKVIPNIVLLNVLTSNLLFIGLKPTSFFGLLHLGLSGAEILDSI